MNYEKYRELNEQAKAYLTELISKKDITKNLLRRCNKEINLLYDKGSLFVIEYLYRYKLNSKKKITYYFKGSTNNLLLLYVLGISVVDPIKYNLPYELFNDSIFQIGILGDKSINFIKYLSSKLDVVYGNYEKEGIEEIDKMEDNHYLLIPSHFANFISTRTNDKGMLETIEDYRKLKKDYMTIRVDELKQHKLGLEDVLNNDFELELANILKPKTFNDYVKIISIGRGTKLWKDNQDILVKENKINLTNLITSREDILEYLLDHSIEKGLAIEMVNFIRKGKKTTEPKKWIHYFKIMKRYNCEDKFILIFSKIQFIYFRGDAVSKCLYALNNNSTEK